MTSTGVELRPRSVGEVLGLTFDLYRRNFPLFIGITALVAVPILGLLALANLAPALQVALAAGGDDGQNQSAAGMFIALTYVSCCLTGVVFILGIFWPWMEGALTHNVIERVLGRSPGLRESYRETRPRFGALWASNILAALGVSAPSAIAYGLFLLGLILAGAIVAAGGGESTQEATNAATAIMSLLCLPVFLVTTVISIVLAINWAFRVPAIVGEGVDAIQAFSRSTTLARGDRWRILGRYVLLALVEFILVAVPLLIVLGAVTIGIASIAATGQPANVGGAMLPMLVGVIIIAAGLGFIATLLITPLRIVYTALNYLDLRTRKENLALQMAQAAPVVVAKPDTTTSVIMPVSTSSPTVSAPIVVMQTSPYPESSTPYDLPFDELPPGQRIGVLFNRLRAEGDSPQVLSQLGTAYMEIGDLWGALEAFTRARTLAPADADIAYNLMLLQLQRKDVNAARQLMQDYLRLETNPNDAMAVRNNPRFKDVLSD